MGVGERPSCWWQLLPNAGVLPDALNRPSDGAVGGLRLVPRRPAHGHYSLASHTPPKHRNCTHIAFKDMEVNDTMGDDPELAAIRAKRKAELEGGSQGMSPQQQQAGSQAERAAQQQQIQNQLLNQALDQQARARLNTIMLAKPEKGRQMESMICQMAASGQIGGKLSENDLVSLVERINAQTKKKTKVIFDRRRAAIDSDEDDW